MSFLVFSSKPEAVLADRQIARNHGCGAAGDVTVQWYGVTIADDGSAYLPSPEPEFADGIVGGTVVEEAPYTSPPPALA